MVKDSRISGFYKLTREERVKKLAELTGLGEDDLGPLVDPNKVDLEVLDHMIERRWNHATSAWHCHKLPDRWEGLLDTDGH